jgi:hypothetical protein
LRAAFIPRFVPLLLAIMIILNGAACTVQAPTPTATPRETVPTRLPTATPSLVPTATPVATTASPEPLQPRHESSAIGVSTWYPEDWVVREQTGQVVFATSEESIEAGGLKAGAALLVAGRDPEWPISFEDMVRWSVAEIGRRGEVETGEVENRVIGGEKGIIVAFEGITEDGKVPARGFVAGVAHESWGYLFVGVSVLEEWPLYGPVLETMLESVQFTVAVVPTATPARVVFPDAWEPDDSAVDARPIEVGEAQTHNVHLKGDRDWVYFEAMEGTAYVIQTSNLGDDVDTAIELYNAEGTRLASDDDGGEGPYASRLQWTARRDGRLYAEIRDFGERALGPETSYDVSLSLGEPFEGDQYEPDDSLPQAKRIAVGEPQTHNLHVLGDHDWVCFEAAAGSVYVIRALHLGRKIDTIVFLYDQEDNELASDDDGAMEELASRVEWAAEKDGTLCAMIRDLRDSAAGPGTEYEVSVSLKEPGQVSGQD